jgi:adenosylcobinamide kinase/adenosylcobinamide-phosphate guanylyltransferase
MAARIAAHRARRGAGWHTIEAPRALTAALAAASREGRPVLVDCLTLWLSNVIEGEDDADARCRELLAALAAAAGPVVAVSNEVGLGIVPDNPLARRFRDAQGRLNAEVAALADRAILMTAGLPLVLK